MPGGDKTGPMGDGPMTGRGAGFCARRPGLAPAGRGRFAGGPYGPGYRGYGSRPGRGGGYRARYWSEGWPRFVREPEEDTLSAADETKLLRAEAERMQSALDAIKDRLEQLETT